MLDTTYLMPAIGVSVKGVPNEAVISLLKSGEQLAISEVTIFELLAKGAKHVRAGKISTELVTRGMKAIEANEQLEKFPIYEEEQSKIALQLRRSLKDFIDCLIVATALVHCESLITEDNLILELRKSENYRQLVATNNSRFLIKKSTDVLAQRK